MPRKIEPHQDPGTIWLNHCSLESGIIGTRQPFKDFQKQANTQQIGPPAKVDRKVMRPVHCLSKKERCTRKQGGTGLLILKDAAIPGLCLRMAAFLTSPTRHTSLDYIRHKGALWKTCYISCNTSTNKQRSGPRAPDRVAQPQRCPYTQRAVSRKNPIVSHEFINFVGGQKLCNSACLLCLLEYGQR
jgi:hypothetical protein